MRDNINCNQGSWCLWPIFIIVFILGLCAFFPMMTYAADTVKGDILGVNGSDGLLFTPSSNDQSIIYLGELFGSMPPVLAGTGSSLMGGLFKTFNTAVLTLGIIIAGYTTFVGILNTAGEGEMLGKAWSSIWIPIRTIAGIALLIPTSSGYCVVQIFMMWLLIQGIGAADTLTGGIISYMEGGQSVYVEGNVPNSSGTTSLVKDWDTYPITAVYEGLSCMQGLQRNYPEVNAAYVSPPTAVDMPFTSSDTYNPNPASATTNPIYYNFIAYKKETGTNPDGTPASTPISCGTLTLDNSTADLQENKNPYVMQGLSAIMPSLNAAAYYMVNDPSTSQDTVMKDTFNFVGSDFMNEIALTYNSYIIQASNAGSGADGSGSYYEAIRDYGWITIGNLYWNMAKASGGGVSSSAKTAAQIEWTSGKSIGDLASQTSYDGTKGCCITEGNSSVWAYGNTYASQFMLDLITSRNANNGGSGSFHSAEKIDYSNATNGMMSAMTEDVLNQMLTSLNSSTKSPMESAQHLGHQIIYNVEALMTAFVAFQIAFPIIVGALAMYASSVFAMTYGPTIAIIGLLSEFAMLMTMPFVFIMYAMLLSLGSVLAVIIPLIPALAFFLAAIAWMIATLETIIAAPIVAIGLIHPDGQHPVWGKAEPAIMLMINMFLRPSLMVLAMAAGVLLSFISVQFVNFGYAQAMASILGGVGDANNGADGQVMSWNTVSGGVTWVEATMFLSTYVGLILACVNKSFSVIDTLPDTVMRWVQGGEGARFGGGADAMQKLQGTQESAGQKAAGDGVSSGQESGQAVDKFAEKNENRLKAVAVAKEASDKLKG